MDKLRPLVVAAPAFALGCLLTASVTTTARADPARAAAKWTYRVAGSQNEMVSLTSDGWEYVGESAATYGSSPNMTVDRRYTLRKRE